MGPASPVNKKRSDQIERLRDRRIFGMGNGPCPQQPRVEWTSSTHPTLKTGNQVDEIMVSCGSHRHCPSGPDQTEGGEARAVGTPFDHFPLLDRMPGPNLYYGDVVLSALRRVRAVNLSPTCLFLPHLTRVPMVFRSALVARFCV